MQALDKIKNNTRIHRLSLALVTLILPILAWNESVGGLSSLFAMNPPAGQYFYLFSKLFGMLACVVIWTQIIIALISRTEKIRPFFMRFFNFSKKDHYILGMTTTFFVILHIGGFVLGVGLRTGNIPLHLFLPLFDSDFYHRAIALGACAFWVLILIVVTGVMRRISSSKVLSWAHKLWYFFISLVLVHAFLIGTEFSSGLMLYINITYLSAFILAFLFYVKDFVMLTRYGFGVPLGK